MPGLLPIVYVGGSTGWPPGTNAAVIVPPDDFDAAATRVSIGGARAPGTHRLTGALHRLVGEMGYRPHVAASTSRDGAGTRRLGRPGSFSIETAAEDLLRLVEDVRAETGAPRVHLVAHSTGGLVCRSMIQRFVPDRYAAGSGVRARDLVDRLLTYGTPHGGMDLDAGSGLAEAVRAEVRQERMYQYLTPSAQREPRVPDAWDPRVNPDEENFPTRRIFCLVGTDATGHAILPHGRSAQAVSAPSDGLVPVRNAVIAGADHALVHRNHSGPNGLAESQEGHQTLVRFLFGDVRLTADLVRLRFPRAGGLTWQAETRTSVRGLPVLLHERTAAHNCPVLVEEPGTADLDDRTVPLVTTHLWSRAAGRRTRMRCVVHVRLLSTQHDDGPLHWDDHVEGSADVDDRLVIDVEQLPGGFLVAWATWASDIGVPLHSHCAAGEPLPDLGKGSGSFRAEIRLPRSGAFLGDKAAVALSVQPAE